MGRLSFFLFPHLFNVVLAFPTGGGTLVTVGVHNVGAFLGIIRAGMGQFTTGGGVLMHIGHLQPRAWGKLPVGV